MAGMSNTLGTAVVYFKAVTADFDKGVKTMSENMTKFGNGLNRVGTSMGAIGRTATLLGATLSAPLVAGAKSAADFDKAFREVRTIMGETSDKELATLKEGMEDLAILIGEDVTGVTRGLYQAISAGVPKENVLDFMDTAAKLAKAGVTDLFQSVDALTTVVNSYGSDVISAQEASDILFKTVEQGKTTMPELASNIGTVAATAAVAGVSFEELGTFIATLTKNGLDTAMTMTALNQLMLNIVAPTSQAKEAMNALGLDFSQTHLKAVGLKGIMEELVEATDKDIEAVSVLLPNIRALRGALVATAQDGRVLNEVQAKMAEHAGATEKAFAIMQKSFTERFNTMKETAKKALRDIGEAMLEVFETDLERIQKRLDELTKWIDENPEQVREMVEVWYAWAKVLTVGGPILVGLGLVVSTLANLVLLLANAAPALLVFKNAWIVVDGLLIKLAATAGTLAGAFEALLITLAAVAGEIAGATGLGAVGAAAATVALVLAGLATTVWTLYRAFQTLRTVWDYRRSLDETADTAMRAARELGVLNDKLKEQWKQLQDTKNPWVRLYREMQFAGEVTSELSKRTEDLFVKQRDAILEIIKTLDVQRERTDVAADALKLLAGHALDESQAVAIAVHDLSDDTLGNILQLSKETQLRIVDAARQYTAENKIFTDEIAEQYATLTDKEIESAAQHEKIAEQRKKVDSATREQIREMLDEAVRANDLEKFSEEERIAALHMFRTNEITLEQSVAAIKHNLSVAEIKQMAAGLQVEEIVAARKKEIREGDTADLARKLAENRAVYDAYVENYKARSDEILKRIAEIKEQRAALNRDDATYAQQWRTLREEEASLQGELTRMQREDYTLRQDIAKQKAELVRAEIGLTSELTESQMNAAQMTQALTEARIAAYQDQYDAVITGLGSLSEVYNNLDANQKAFIDARIAEQLNWMLSIDSTAEGASAAVANVTNEVRGLLSDIASGQMKTSESFRLAAQSIAEYGGVYGQHGKDLQTLASAYDYYNQQLVVVRERISDHQQAIDNWNASGKQNTAIVDEHQRAIAALQRQEDQLIRTTFDLNDATGSSITAMTALRDRTEERLRQLDEQIAKARAEGESTEALWREYDLLNTQYRVVNSNLKQVSSGSYDAHAAQQAEASSARDVGQAQQQRANTEYAVADAVEEAIRKTEEMPQRTQQAMQATGGLWDGFLNTLQTMVANAWQNIWSWFDPTARHSPSPVETIVRGQQLMRSAWEKHLALLLDMFKKKYADQLELLRQFGEPLAVHFETGPGGNILGANIRRGPEGLTEQDVVAMQRDIDRINAEALKIGSDFSLTIETILRSIVGAMSALQSGTQGNLQAGRYNAGPLAPYSVTELPALTAPPPTTASAQPQLLEPSPAFMNVEHSATALASVSVRAAAAVSEATVAMLDFALDNEAAANGLRAALVRLRTGDGGGTNVLRSGGGAASIADLLALRNRDRGDEAIEQDVAIATMPPPPPDDFVIPRPPDMTDEEYEAYRQTQLARFKPRHGFSIPRPLPTPEPEYIPPVMGHTTGGIGTQNVTINAQLSSMEEQRAFVEAIIAKYLRDTRRRNV